MVFFILFVMTSVLFAAENACLGLGHTESCATDVGDQTINAVPPSWSLLRTDAFPYELYAKFVNNGAEILVSYRQNSADDEGIFRLEVKQEYVKYVTFLIQKSSITVTFDSDNEHVKRRDHYFHYSYPDAPDGEPDVVVMCSYDAEGVALRQFICRSEDDLCGRFIGASVKYATLDQPKILLGLASYTGDVLSQKSGLAFHSLF